MSDGSERRRVTRIAAGIEARLDTGERESVRVRVANLSVVGLRGCASHALAAGQRCRVELGVSGSAIHAIGTVVRAEGEELAVRFDQLPYESYESLRAWLLANAHDPAVITDELSDRMGFLDEAG